MRIRARDAGITSKMRYSLPVSSIPARRPSLPETLRPNSSTITGSENYRYRIHFLRPLSSVLVYGTARSVGHVEIRTKDGFVSDFRSPIPSRRPLMGVYAKL